MNNVFDSQQIELDGHPTFSGNLFDLVPCAITIQDRNYRILRHNTEFANMFGYKVGEYCFSAYKGRRQKCADCPLEKTFNDGLIHSSQESGLSKDGTSTYWIVKTTPIKDKNGNLIAAMEMSIDITEQIETEHQLIQASKLATLGEMATGVAHELNQPLSVIKTASSFLTKKTNAKEPVDDKRLLVLLNKIDSNVDRASKIISHLRMFARKSDDRRDDVNINHLLENVFEIVNQQLKVRNIQIDKEYDNALPLITGDPIRLEQVFINLLLNARDAIEEKWKDRECRPGDKRIVLKTAGKTGDVIVEIRDSGIGIPKKYQDKIFEPFFTTKEVGSGTGLGLSISYGIIKECGGSIRVRSAINEGSVFTVRLPAKRTTP
jgi:histidine kinase